MRFVWLLVLAVFAVGSPAANSQELADKEKVAARKIYVAKCAKCHKFYEPKDYEEEDWRKWMESMNRKSKLKEDQATLLTRYLDDYRAGRIPGKPQDKPKRK